MMEIDDEPPVMGAGRGPAPMPTQAEYIEALKASRTDLHGALYRCYLEAQGCNPVCSHEFHKMAVASILQIAGAALKRFVPPTRLNDVQKT